MTRIEFIKFLKEFKEDFDIAKDNSRNKDLSSFLEGMISYTEDIQGFYDNLEMDIDANVPTWNNFSQILKGALIYE